MSSKSRRKSFRRPSKPSPYQQLAGRAAPEQGRPAARSRTLLVWLGLAVVAGAIVYAATGTKRPKDQAATAPAPTPPAAAPPAPAAAPAPPPVPVSGPRIQFAQQVYDFGKANGDDQVDCLFVFTNTGNALLELTEVSPGCGCMKAGEWTRKVEPGQTGTIPVRLDTHHYTGYFAKSVFVTCNDAAQPKPMLEIKGTVWRPLEITPPNAVINVNTETPSNAASVRIINHTDQPMTLSDLAINSRALAVELQTNQPGKEFQVNVKTLPPWPTNSQQSQITLKSSLTNAPVIDIKAWLNVQATVTAIPFQVRLPPLPLTNAFPATVWIRNNGTSHLALSEASVNATGVVVQIKEDQPGRQMSLALNFPSGFDAPAGQPLELRVKSNHPQFPLITVPILQMPRPAPSASAGQGPAGQPVAAPQPAGR